MPINTDPRYVGRASMTPADSVVAGQLGTWTITYEVGAYGYDEFARLKIASRFASDWGPRSSAPREARTIRRSASSRAAPRPSPTSPGSLAGPSGSGSSASWCRYGTGLYSGDKIHVTIGDRSGGGPGSRAQTFREKGCELRVLVDPFGTELYSVLASSPLLDIVGGEIHRLVVVAPTRCGRASPSKRS